MEMDIKVTVILPGIPEALNNLANALTNQALKMSAYQTVIPAAPNSKPAEIDGSNVSAVEQPTPAPVTEPAIEPAPVAEPAAEEVVAPATPAPVLPQTPAAEPASTKKYTRDEIATAGSALVTQGKMNDLLALLQKYGVQSVAQLNPDQYDVFAADLKALGAAL